jgi:hypothetical protein
VYSPIHYQELPELFMDFIASLTGKSPSTTGAGSEGALTKGPFNALRHRIDLNNALVSFILCGHPASPPPPATSARKYRVDHDISLLMPEVWCRMTPNEREPPGSSSTAYLEKVRGLRIRRPQPVLASRLGYRNQPALHARRAGQDLRRPDAGVRRSHAASRKPRIWPPSSMASITSSKRTRRFAKGYLADGSIADACPPLQALLHIMAEGQFPTAKTCRTRTSAPVQQGSVLLASDWYKQRPWHQAAARHGAVSPPRRLPDGNSWPKPNTRCEPEGIRPLRSSCWPKPGAKLDEVGSPAYLENPLG